MKRLLFTLVLWLAPLSAALAQSVGGSTILQLPQASTPLSGTEIIPLVQSGTTKQTAVGNIAGAAALGFTQIPADDL